MSVNKKQIQFIFLSTVIVLITIACGTFQVGIVSPEDGPQVIATNENTAFEVINLEPTSHPVEVEIIPTQTLLTTSQVEPGESTRADWTSYRNDDYRYQISYPIGASINLLGPQSFSNAELPQGMSPADFLDQISAEFGNELCAIIEYEGGYVAISAPPNQFHYYTNCNTPSPGVGEAINKSESVQVGGHSYQASGIEFVPSVENPYGYFESCWFELEDRTLIRYGSDTGSEADQKAYIENTKPILLQIVDTYLSLQDANTPISTATPLPNTGVPLTNQTTPTAIPNADNKLTYENLSFGFRFYYPGEWNLTDDVFYTELSNGPLYLRIAYRGKEHSVTLLPHQFPGGELNYDSQRENGTVQFLETDVPRVELVDGRQVIAVLYNGEEIIRTPHVDFSIALAVLSDSQGITDEQLEEVDAILESFEWIY